MTIRQTRQPARARQRLTRTLVATLLGGAALIAPAASPNVAHAETLDVAGEVVGADVEGAIWLTFDPDGGPVSGRIEMTVQFDCRGKRRDEHHVMEITKGSIEGDRLQATAVYVERSGLPKDELSRCKSAYETYQTREDSRRLIGTIDREGMRAAGTLGEYRPTVSWRISWEPPAELPLEGEPRPEPLPAESPADEAPPGP